MYSYFLIIIVTFFLQTPFVRQNTPHPRELKAKAHKLFSKGQNSLEESDLQPEQVVEAINQNLVAEQVVTKVEEEESLKAGNGQDENSEPSVEDDIDDVSEVKFLLLYFLSFSSRLPTGICNN